LKISERFFNVLDYAETNLISIGLLGGLGYPVYFFIWTYLFPQPYENIWLRITCAIAYIPWIFYSKFFRKYKSYFSIYFIFSLIFTLPYFFSFMFIKNGFSYIWAMSLLASLCLLIIVVYDWLLVTAIIFIGFVLSYLSVGDSVNIGLLSLEFIPIFSFIVIGCMLATHRRKIDQQLRIKHTKSLAGTIAHEMRNPLSQINGTLHLLWKEKAPDFSEADVYIDNLKQIIKSSFQLIDITMDAINEKPIKKNDFKIISALDICNEAVSEYAYKELEQRQKVSVVGSDFQILADPVLIKYILFNLINNALYYVQSNPNSKIVVTVLEDQRKIEVSDNGPGIAPESLPKLFDSFYTSNKSGGTGLGLAYCKRTMQALGGDIHCISKLGEFTSFILTFPDHLGKKLPHEMRRHFF
jgi:two-component system CAI-1 autoinducer sensor kinase/phosphatase CqsS